MTALAEESEREMLPVNDLPAIAVKLVAMVGPGEVIAMVSSPFPVKPVIVSFTVTVTA